jgi:hypothetical protein
MLNHDEFNQIYNKLNSAFVNHANGLAKDNGNKPKDNYIYVYLGPEVEEIKANYAGNIHCVDCEVDLIYRTVRWKYEY